ncbi:tetratricopeptide repeat-containing sensor histidine kinase [Chitinophaga sp. 22620]|uniref:tetratricopeptide repeat-containing sensor histidine kinase n=1 Tax=Chitinophaga sp. 22620 TaxID=3453952 RepID=UPI003F83880F
MIAVIACTPATQKTYEHPAYFDTVFARAYTIEESSVAASHAYLEDAYARFPEAGKADLFRKYAFMHLYSMRIFNYQKAMLYADSMLTLFNDKSLQQRYPLNYAQALLSRGDVLRDQKKYNEAYLYFYRGREVLQKTNDTCLYHEYASRLALVYYRQEKYPEAARYFSETFQWLSRCDTSSFNTFYVLQGMLDNTALSYDKAGNDRRALALYDSTLDFIRKRGAKFLHIPDQARGIKAATAVVYGNKGSLLLRMGDTLAAESLFRQSIAINLHGRDEKKDAQMTMAKLAALYLSRNFYDSARAVLREMKSSLDMLPDAEIRQRWLSLQWQYYEKTDQQNAGYAALKDYVTLKDSLAAAAPKPVVADINKEFERMAGEHRLEILQKNNELKTAYLFILVFLCLSVILIAVMIWQNWRKSRRHVAALQLLNQEVTTQHEHIQKSLAALEQSQQNHYRMMKIVAHDLRNPVGAINTIASLLLMANQPERKEQDKEMIELISTSSVSALNLISDLLELDTSLTNMEMEILEIDVALKYCVDLLQTKAMEKNQSIRLHAEPVQVMACPEKIWRVFSNLINNAIKFSPDGAHIEVELKRQNGNVRVAVKDQGIGIPPSMQGKIFSQTTEVKRKGTRGEASFGFGLSISKQIIEAHDGIIWFETEEGKGTTFYIEMKAASRK